MGNTQKPPVAPPHADSAHTLDCRSRFLLGGGGGKEFRSIDTVLCVTVALSSVTLDLF